MKFKLNAIVISAVFSLLIVAIALIVDNTYNKWTTEVIQTNKVLCEVIVRQLNSDSYGILDSLENASYFDEGYKSSIQLNRADKLLSRISSKNLESATGVEGGFYFQNIDQFQGYSYPTSPPPMPVYGPPPRSFNIIKEQVKKSVEKDSLIVNLHQFDPAIFPLASMPIKIKGKIIGAVWTRIHIERELPRLKLTDILNIAAVLSLLGFIVAVIATLQQRKRLAVIKKGLTKIEAEPTFRFGKQPGIFGDISGYINNMIEAVQSEHNKSQKLERELHQQDKMASLGKLVAGVAHEVKTPLAIIKTRIQMWQQKLISEENNATAEKLISDESLQLVINEINRLSNLVNRLLIFSKPVEENFQLTDLNALVFDLLPLFKLNRYREKATVEFEASPVPIKIEIDPNKIEQVILNIITNSFEAIKFDGIINIKTDFKDNFALISISDNGAGIPINVQKNIFDPFFTTKGNGTGLGLSIAYEIVHAHKGKIEFTTEEGKGSTFNIHLPLTRKKSN